MQKTATRIGTNSLMAGDGSGSSQNTAPINDSSHYQGKKVGRNDLCPCGSGLKFKKCHGK